MGNTSAVVVVFLASSAPQVLCFFYTAHKLLTTSVLLNSILHIAEHYN